MVLGFNFFRRQSGTGATPDNDEVEGEKKQQYAELLDETVSCTEGSDPIIIQPASAWKNGASAEREPSSLTSLEEEPLIKKQIQRKSSRRSTASTSSCDIHLVPEEGQTDSYSQLNFSPLEVEEDKQDHQQRQQQFQQQQQQQQVSCII